MNMVSHHIRSNVVGYVAVFIALSGTAWAAGTIGPSELKNNAVHSSHIKKAAIGPSEIQKDAVRSKHVKNGEVSTFDIGNETVRSMDIKDGEVSGADVLNASLSGGDVLDESLTGDDIADDSLSGVDISNGTVGSEDIRNGSIEAIDLGTTADGPGFVFGGKDDTGLFCRTYCTQGKISPGNLGGSTLVIAKIGVDAKEVGQDLLQATCRLRTTTGNTDVARVATADNTAVLGGATLSMHLVQHFLSSDEVLVECLDTEAGPARGVELRITAIRLGVGGFVEL